jgi:hypothetical protein
MAQQGRDEVLAAEHERLARWFEAHRPGLARWDDIIAALRRGCPEGEV